MARGKGASRQHATNPVPGWAWLTAGIALGASGMGLLYWQTQSPSPPPSDQAQQEAEEQPDAASTGLDFYTLLPKMEVVVPRPSPSQNQTTPPEPVAEPGTYILQAGSFQTYEDADRRKASLALLGIESHIETVTIDDRQTWHRVRIGPYQDRKRLNRIREQLHQQDIEAMVLRVKG